MAEKMLLGVTEFIHQQQQNMEMQLQSVADSSVSKIMLHDQTLNANALQKELATVRVTHQKEIHDLMMEHQNELAKQKLSPQMFKDWTGELETEVQSELHQLAIVNKELQRSEEQKITNVPDDVVVVGVTVGSVTVDEPIMLVPDYLSDFDVVPSEPNV
ncbi:hypothetical protein GOP47_0008848 [Adiantum capillus-veneris]|uniref:Uncharacterized protein n=1 Tax=Adiantum capillus-veneris TaxID=13818 RepID=A0A9D4UZC3_ADICA|nr:hypothetical protein GOP47_0008848 [Adiantum capillus-veneris]